MSGSLIDGGVGASAYFWPTIWVLTLLPMAVVLVGLVCRGIGGVLSIIDALWPATHRSQADAEAARNTRTKTALKYERFDALLEALGAEALPYTSDEDVCLSVSVPIDEDGSQSVQLAGDAIFTPILSFDNDSRAPDAISILAPAAGFEVAVVRRNGRCNIGLCARVPAGSKPAHVVKLIKRLGKCGFEARKNLGHEQL